MVFPLYANAGCGRMISIAARCSSPGCETMPISSPNGSEGGRESARAPTRRIRLHATIRGAPVAGTTAMRRDWLREGVSNSGPAPARQYCLAAGQKLRPEVLSVANTQPQREINSLQSTREGGATCAKIEVYP